MTRGRKPLPQEILNLRGTDRKTRQRPSSTFGETIPVADIRKCQVAGLKSATERATRIYWATVRKVAALGILEESFCTQLLIYAVEYDHFLTCSEDIKEKGIYITVEAKNGNMVVPNPSVKMRDNAIEKILKISSNFGFSPVDVQRIKRQTETEDKKLLAFAAIFQDESDEPDIQTEQL